MNVWWSPRILLILLLGVIGIPLCAGAVCASDGSTSVLQANFVYEFVADRSRMIQVSLVFVALGCALIWWYK